MAQNREFVKYKKANRLEPAGSLFLRCPAEPCAGWVLNLRTQVGAYRRFLPLTRQPLQRSAPEIEVLAQNSFTHHKHSRAPRTYLSTKRQKKQIR